MTRLEATRSMTAWFGDRAVIASLGHPAYDLFAAGDRPANFYTWGSMGLASSIGLGLAMAQPERRVIVLDGGSIAEEGDHETLLGRQGLYADLYRMQLLADELEAL